MCCLQRFACCSITSGQRGPELIFGKMYVQNNMSTTRFGVILK